jgi:hypothetical protein
MKDQLLLILALSSAWCLTACKPTPDLTEKEVYTILNEIIADDSLTINQVCWKFQPLQIPSEANQEFTVGDRLFSSRQSELFKSLKIKPATLKWFRRRNERAEFTAVDTVCTHGILYHLSFPLVSADRRKVLLAITEDCNCMLGGQGTKSLYEKKQGRWVRTKQFDQWISVREKPVGQARLLAFTK